MLAEAILVHGVIGYKFCWLLPYEDRNQGTPIGHESNGAVVGDHWEDMNQLIHQLGTNQDAMNILRLWLTCTTLGHEVKVLDAMNNWGLCFTWMTLCPELRGLDAMKYLGLWLTWRTTGHELKALDTMNNVGLWLTWRLQVMSLGF